MVVYILANIKRNLVYNFILSCSNVLLPLLSIPYVSRVLNPEGIGRVGFVDSFTYYFVIIAEFGVTTYGIREVAKCQNDPAKLKILVPQLLTLHIITSLFTSILYASALFFLWDRIGDTRLVLLSVSFFVVNFFACEWYFMGREKFGYIALRSIVVRLLGLISIFVLIQTPRDYYLYYLAIVGSAILNGIWNYTLLLKEVSFTFKKVDWRKHLRYVWVTYLISLFYSIPLMLDNVLLGLVSTAGMVGVYSLSAKVVRVGTTLLTDSFLVFFPRVVSLSSEKKDDQLAQKLSFNIQFIVLFAIPMCMGIFLLAEELALVFFGNKFADASVNLRILAVFPLIKGISLFLSNPVLIAQHKERTFLKNLVLSSGIFVLMSVVLSHYYSARGACIALLVAELILMLLNVRSVRRLFPQVKLPPRPILQAVIGTIAFIPVTWLAHRTMNAGALRLAVIIFGCIGIYGILLVILRNEFVMMIFRGVKNKYVLKSGQL
ncbi:MAG: flippase [Chitinophagaceae bacterium]